MKCVLSTYELFYCLLYLGRNGFSFKGGSFFILQSFCAFTHFKIVGCIIFFTFVIKFKSDKLSLKLEYNFVYQKRQQLFRLMVNIDGCSN